MRSGGASGNISCSVFSYHVALLNLTRWAFKNSPRLTFDQPKPYVIVSPAIILGLLEADGDFSRGGGGCTGRHIGVEPPRLSIRAYINTC